MQKPQPLLKNFSDDLDPKELLRYMIILYQISLDQDPFELSRFVGFMSKIICPDDFNKMVRRVTRMMNEDTCSDWLLTNLYELYLAYGVD
jgi:hypothetical protein